MSTVAGPVGSPPGGGAASIKASVNNITAVASVTTSNTWRAFTVCQAIFRHHSLLTTNPLGRPYYYHTHFIDKETKAFSATRQAFG